MQQPSKLPVAIITGFLGSGKTTVLNHLVKQPGMHSTAVIINEFGETGIDHLLIETSTELMVELNNGCVCCTIRGDLADKLGSLAMWLDVGRIPPVTRVIVETTGLADPAPIMHTLMTEPHLLERYRLERMLTVVDAVNGATSLARFPEAVKQVAVADSLIVSKTDLIDSHSDRTAYAELGARIRAINPRAGIRETIHGALDPGALFGPPGGEADAAFAELSAWGQATDAGGIEGGCEPHAHDGAHRHERDLRAAGITSFVIELREPVDGERFNALLQSLAVDFGTRILRMKGILQVEGVPDQPAVLHMVQHVVFPVQWLKRWPEGKRGSKLVFITQELAREVIENRLRGQFS
ncbi:MAG: GTP-binding protein [Betaproteobacteria bacterium]|nr:GTP-binding protein [Betaproteobacteria bacterium]